MTINVPVGETDDPYFIVLLNSLVNGLVNSETPDGIWIIHIDNWFDHKWLRFSGIGSVDFRLPFMNQYKAVLDEFSQ